jgi:drug/metabolite transporter (DMT)-like permease
MSAALIAVQPRLLKDQDAAAVTAVQFAAASLVALPFALISGGLPHAPSGAQPVIAFVTLAMAGTVVPFWLFAHGQKGTSAEFAGAMVNIEPLVGAMVGWVAFSDPVGPWQISGAVAVVAGILLSTVPWHRITPAGLPEWLLARFQLP